MSVSSQLKDGGNDYAQININSAGHDDRILRGDGILQARRRTSTPSPRRNWPRKGDWAFYANFGIDNSGIGDADNERHSAGTRSSGPRTSSTTT